jgi:hypothetical protein
VWLTSIVRIECSKHPLLPALQLLTTQACFGAEVLRSAELKSVVRQGREGSPYGSIKVFRALKLSLP